MKARMFLPVVFLAFIFATPLAQAQDLSNSQERKLKREMKKLQKQMKKVQELRTYKFDFDFDRFDFDFDRSDFFDAKQIQKLKANEFIHQEMAEKQRIMAKRQRVMAMKQAEKAQIMARKLQKENLKKVLEFQHQNADQTRRVLDEYRNQLEQIREHYPDGFELPEIDIDIPDFKFDFPRIDIDIPELVDVYTRLTYAYESDNYLTIKKSLDNESVEKEHNYTVSEDASYVDLRIKGSVESGELTIVLKTPEDKEYQTVTLNSSADINWSQKMKLQGEDKEKYKGKWTISVKGEDVKGHYSIYMRSK